MKSVAQDSVIAPVTRQELWPEIDFYYRFNDKFRLYSSFSATQLKSSSYTDGGLSINLDYFSLPVWRKAKSRADSARGHLLWFRGGFAYSRSPHPDDGGFREYNILTELSFRIYLPAQILVNAKTRFDWRFRAGEFLPRYRPKLQFERNFNTAYLHFSGYTYIEYFLNFKDASNGRLRLALGSELKVTKHLNFEFYYVYQFENTFDNLAVNAFGLAAKIYLHKGDPIFPKKKNKQKTSEVKSS